MLRVFSTTGRQPVSLLAFRETTCAKLSVRPAVLYLRCICEKWYQRDIYLVLHRYVSESVGL